MRKALWILALLVLLAGCSAGETVEPAADGDVTVSESPAPAADEGAAAEAEAEPVYAGNETGNAELDAAVYELLLELCPPEADAADNLAAVYGWVCDEITYRAGTTDVSGGFTDELTQELALEGLSKRKGNCDTEAAIMAVLLERLGYDCQILQGQFQREDGQWVDHAWVLAQVDGEALHFDPLYGRYYADDPMDYFMQPDDAMTATHRWDAAADAA